MRVAVLGPLEIEGQPNALGPRDKVALAALCAADGETLTAEQLSDALWRDLPPKSASKVIQGAVMRLRRLLGPAAIETTGGGYRFVPDVCELDAAEFEGLVDHGRRLLDAGQFGAALEVLGSSLRLWRGQPFSEVSEWEMGRAEAARLVEIRRSVEEDYVEAQLGAGRAGEAAAAARRLVTREPFREHRWALLALALYRMGRQRDALEALRQAQTTLRDELGLDLGVELTDLQRAVLEQDPALLRPEVEAAEPSLICPYPGLRAFDTDFADYYFGRERDIEAALDRLNETPMLVVVGTSGSGKSSLVHAGVVAELMRQGRRIAIIAPGAAPLTSLTVVIASSEPPDVLVVDQLEEVFAVPDDRDVKEFLAQLADFAESGKSVIVTLRADYLASLSAHPTLARLAERGLLLLAPLEEAALRTAITEPARMSGLVLEPGLVELLLRDVVDETGGLPLMSHALAEAWSLREGRLLTVEAFERTGGIKGAVAQTAERLYEQLSDEDKRTMRAVFQRLVTPTASGSPVAVRAALSVFDGYPDAKRVIDLLAQARLLTVSSDSVAVAHESLIRAWPRLRKWLDEDATAQRLLQHLQAAAAAWQEAGKPDDELYRGARLEAVLEWHQDAHAVLSASELQFLAASSDLATREQRGREAQLAQQKHRNRQLRSALVGVVALLVFALVAGTIAYAKGHDAQQAAEAAGSSALNADAARLAATSVNETQPDVSLLLARQAVAMSANAANESSLARAIAQQPGLIGSTHVSLDFSDREPQSFVNRDGTRYLVSAYVDRGNSTDNLLSRASYTFLVDTTTGKLVGGALGAPRHPDVRFESAAAGFIDNGAIAVIARASWKPNSWPVELVRFRASDGVQIGNPEPVPLALLGDRRDMDRPRLSADGNVLVSLFDRQVRIWTRRHHEWSGPRTVALPQLSWTDFTSDRVQQIVLSNDGGYAIVRLEYYDPGSPKSATSYVSALIDVRTAKEVGPALRGSQFDLRGPSAVAISQDGALMAAGYGAGRVQVRSTRSGKAFNLDTGRSVTSLLFSPTARALAVGDSFGTVTICELATHDCPTKYVGFGSAVLSMGFAPGGLDDRVLDLDASGRITQHHVDGSNRFLLSRRLGGIASAVAASRSGSVIALGMDSGLVESVNPTNLRTVRRFHLGPYNQWQLAATKAGRGAVGALAVLPDGSAIIGADGLGHLSEWSVADGHQLWSRSDVYASKLAVSPDGRWLATLESTLLPDLPYYDPLTLREPSSLRIWNLETHRLVRKDRLPQDVSRFSKAIATSPKLTVPDISEFSASIPTALAFTSDSSELAVAVTVFHPSVFVYNLITGVKRQVTDAESTAITFGPRGHLLVVRDAAGTVVTIDSHSGVRRALNLVMSPFGDITYSADGKRLVGLSTSGLELWDANSGRSLASVLSMSDTSDQSQSHLVAAEGDIIYATRGDSLIRLDGNPQDWPTIACTMAGRQLTKVEWRQFLPSQPYHPSCAPQGHPPTELLY